MNTKESCIMVFVTAQQSCARLIEAGYEIAEKTNQKLKVISIINKFDEKTTKTLKELYDYVDTLNAEMNLYVNNEPFITAAVAAKRFNATEIITGFPKDNGSPFIYGLHSIVPDVPITMVDEGGTQYRIVQYTKEELKELKANISLK